MNTQWVKTENPPTHARIRAHVSFLISLASFQTIQAWKNFDADTGKHSAREVREYFIPDFSDWKNHDEYQAAFERLIRDLKATHK